MTTSETSAKVPDWQFQGKSVRVLFLCVHNRARSQMAEALLRHLGQGQIEVFSAGSDPAPSIHPAAVRAIARLGADMSQYVPKSLEQFQGQSFDRVIIIGDPEQETCPTFAHDPEPSFWNIPDPLAKEESAEEQARTFDRLALELNTRVRLLLTLLEREKRAGA